METDTNTRGKYCFTSPQNERLIFSNQDESLEQFRKRIIKEVLIPALRNVLDELPEALAIASRSPFYGLMRTADNLLWDLRRTVDTCTPVTGNLMNMVGIWETGDWLRRAAE